MLEAGRRDDDVDALVLKGQGQAGLDDDCEIACSVVPLRGVFRVED